MCWKQIAIIAVVMVALDAVWLAYVAPTFRTMVAAIQKSPMQIRWIPAAIVYVLMIAGLWWFVVRPATSWESAAANGAALGAVVYGVYDMTNLTTLTNYSPAVAIKDMAWGSFLFAATAATACALT
jgi:uncharacterized membrane protein